MPSGSPCFAVSVLLLLGSLSCRSRGLSAIVIVQRLNKTNMLIVRQKGRLLHLACDHAMKYFQDGVVEAGMWTRASFGGHQDLLEEAVGKSTMGVDTSCSTPCHHETLLHAWNGSTAGAACLVTAMMHLRLVHLDDSVGEGPHSAATRIGAASRAPTWGWIASTMRMKQNLVEFVSLIDEAHLARQQLWNKYKFVLQRRQQSRVRGQRNFRCSRALLEKQVYVLDRHFDPDGEHSVVAGDGPLASCRPDRAALEGGEEDPDDGAIVAASPRVDAAGRGLHIGQRLLGRCLAVVRVRVGAREKWLCCALDRLPSSGEVGQAHPRDYHRHETEAQDVLVSATAGAS